MYILGLCQVEFKMCYLMSQEGMLIISPKECGILLHCNVQNWVLILSTMSLISVHHEVASKEWEMRILDLKHKILYSLVGRHPSLHFFICKQYSDHLCNMDNRISFQTKNQPTTLWVRQHEKFHLNKLSFMLVMSALQWKWLKWQNLC